MIFYVSFATLQAYDGYATMLGITQGAVEANPLTRSIAGNPPLVWTVKVGTTAVAIAASESLWHRHRRRQAIALMLISNGIATVVAAHKHCGPAPTALTDLASQLNAASSGAGDQAKVMENRAQRASPRRRRVTCRSRES